MNQAIYLKNLQIVLEKFEPIIIFNKNDLIQYFWDSFYLLIQAQLDDQDCYLNIWDEIMKRTIDVKGKTGQ